MRQLTLLMNITHRLLDTKYRDPADEPKVHLFGQFKRINNLGRYGRWAFVEFTDVWEMQSDLEKEIARGFDKMIYSVLEPQLC